MAGVLIAGCRINDQQGGYWLPRGFWHWIKMEKQGWLGQIQRSVGRAEQLVQIKHSEQSLRSVYVWLSGRGTWPADRRSVRLAAWCDSLRLRTWTNPGWSRGRPPWRLGRRRSVGRQRSAVQLASDDVDLHSVWRQCRISDESTPTQQSQQPSASSHFLHSLPPASAAFFKQSTLTFKPSRSVSKQSKQT